MAEQLTFPGDFPPEKKRSELDIIIDHIYQVLPAPSGKKIVERLKQRGLPVNMEGIRRAIKYLRKHCAEYQWTIPHVHTGRTNDDKYFALLMAKDRSFHVDPRFKGSLSSGTVSIVTRVATESRNQSAMLKAAADATYISKALREGYRDMAEDLLFVSNKARRVLRDIKANNG
jgi:hypothetical protein